ncbi:MAG: AEC family transporter [Rubritepida sp.]|nr:AEC family transporter [Rubritepida sp.]
MADAFLVLVEVVAPIFALIFAGWLTAARGWIGREGFAGLNLFAFSLAAPALLFASGTAGHAVAGGAALAFFAGCALLYAAVLWAARRAGVPLAEAGAMALNTTFGNTVMMGIPLILAAYGREGLSVLVAILALHSAALLGTATVVAEVARSSGASARRVLRNTLLGVLRNPIVMAVLLALVWSTLAWPVPGPARRTLELLGAAAPPVSLFCLGASLTGFAARGLWARTGWTVALKLAAMPLRCAAHGGQRLPARAALRGRGGGFGRGGARRDRCLPRHAFGVADLAALSFASTQGISVSCRAQA